MTPIIYIGHRPTYREGCYGSGLVFSQGQTINVDDEALAKKLLKHKDVYTLGEAAELGAIVDADEDQPKSKAPDKDKDEDPAQEMRDSIMTMNKEALETFAKTHFSVDLDKRQKVGDLRMKVIGLFDQFGAE